MAMCPVFKDVKARDSHLTWASSCKNILTDVVILVLVPVIPQTGVPGVGPSGKAAKPGKAPVPGKYMPVSVLILLTGDRLHFILSIS